MGADKGKKMKIQEQEEEDLEIDENLILSIEKLEEVQDELEKVNEEACEKVLEVEQKYNEIRKPVYIKREEVIKTIPDFWATALVSHPYLNGLLRLEDQKVFKYLSSLEVEDFKDVKSGYSITFNFKPNPYFEDTKLSKTFDFPENEITKVTGTTIRWKEGMDITDGANQEIPSGVNNEKKGKKRPYVDDRLSFFCWFGETKPDDIAEVFDDEVAEVIKEELWPNPLKFYNYGDDDEDSEDDDQSDEEANNDEDDDDEDNDDADADEKT